MLAPASEVTYRAGQALLVRNYSAAEPVSLRDAASLGAGTPRRRAVARRHTRPRGRGHACIRLVSRGGHGHGEASASHVAARLGNPCRAPEPLGGRWSIRPARAYSTCREERMTASAVMSAI